MAKIFLRYNFTSVTGQVICTVFANSAPNAELVDKRWVLDDTTGFEKDGTHTIIGLKATMHTIKFYESSDGTTLETLLPSTVNIDASIYNEVILKRYEYTVGSGLSGVEDGKAWADPNDGDTELNDERLAGATSEDAYVHLQGFGDFQKWQITWKPEGGFSFTEGKVFYADERYIVTRIILVAQQVPEAEVVSDLMLRPLVDADFTDGIANFDSSFYGRWCPLEYTGLHCKIVFPDFALIPDTIVEFNTYQGNQIYFDLQFSSGNTVLFNGQAENIINLPKMEFIKLQFASGKCYVRDYHGKVTSRGQIVGDAKDRSISNAGPYLSCVETGSPLDGNIYSGLYKWLTELPAGYTIDMSTWAASEDNKKKWALDTINKTLRPPKVENMHRRFGNPGDVPGTYIPDGNKKHRHFTVGAEAINGNPPGVDANTAIARDNELNSSSSYRLKKSALEPTLGRTSESGGGDEVTTKAFKEIPLVVL